MSATRTAERESTQIPRASYQDVLDAPAHRVAEIVDGTLYTHPRPAHATCTGQLVTRCKDRRPLRLRCRRSDQHPAVRCDHIQPGKPVAVTARAGRPVTE